MDSDKLAREAMVCIEKAKDHARNRKARHRIENWQLFTKGYADPSHRNHPKMVVLGNFNPITSSTRRDAVDNTPYLAGQYLQMMGVSLAKEGKWGACIDCDKLVRTRPFETPQDWQPYFWASRDGILCFDCVQINPRDYLEEYDGGINYLTCPLNLTAWGYECIDAGAVESNQWEGDSIRKKYKEVLEKLGIERFLFVPCSNFHFNLWVHQNDLREFVLPLDRALTDPLEGKVFQASKRIMRQPI